MLLCDTGTISNVGNDCVRAWWTALIPISVVAFNTAKLLYNRLPHQPFATTFADFLPLHEAVSLLNENSIRSATEGELDSTYQHKKELWKVGMLIIPAGLEVVYWAFWTFLDTQKWVHSGGETPRVALYEIITAPAMLIAWVYALMRPVFLRRPLVTPYDLFSLYISIILALGLNIGAAIYKGYIYDTSSSILQTDRGTVSLAIHLLIPILTIAVTLSLPTCLPPPGVDREQIGKRVSPEDYTSLAKWMTFWWIYPIVKRGRGRTMTEGDVWDLPPGIASKPLFVKFSELLHPSRETKQRMGLVQALWKANSRDIIFDFALTLVSIICNYLGPFFLKQILDAVSQSSSKNPSLLAPSISKDTQAQAYVYAFLAFFVGLLKAQADVQHLWYGRRAGARVRTELMAMIYEKSLKRRDLSGITDEERENLTPGTLHPRNGEEQTKKPESKKTGTDIGKLVNLMSMDTNQVGNIVSNLYFIYGDTIGLCIGSVFLYNLLGLSGFAGFIVLLLVAPLNAYLVKRSRDINMAAAQARDKRMKVVNELMSEARFIKFWAGEEKWIQKCMNARGKELGILINSRINNVCLSIVSTSSPVLVSIVSFATFVYTGHQLTVPIAFTAVQIFSMIKWPMNSIPSSVSSLVNTKISLDRIAQFLDEEEVSAFVSDLKVEDHTGIVTETIEREQCLGIKNGRFRWNQAFGSPSKQLAAKKNLVPWKKKERRLAVPESLSPHSSAESNGPTQVYRFELRDIDIMFPTGHLTLVTGPTASGKTALLMALLGEMTPVCAEGIANPQVYLPKHPTQPDENTQLRHYVSYCSQTPWLEHRSIRENVLFGMPMDQDRYSQVLECCALNPDLRVLEDGDETVIGARGVSLSGGQKARVALARAVYTRAKYVLLDDPLSAVDIHTARHIAEKLLGGPLMANRTVVLISHHVELILPHTHYVVKMLDGRIDAQGTVEELELDGVFNTLGQETWVDEATVISPVASVKRDAVTYQDTGNSIAPKKLKTSVEDEGRATGRVKFSIYQAYLKASGYWTWGIILLILALSQIGGVIEKLWMQVWGEGRLLPSQDPSSDETSTGRK